MRQMQRLNAVPGYVGAHGFAQLLLWSAFYYLLPALSSHIAVETGWSVLYLSTTYTLAFLVWALSAPVVGMLIDKGYGSKVMRGGALAGIVLLLGMSQTQNPLVFRVLMVGLGVCMAATLYDPCFALIMRQLKGKGTDAVASVTLIAGFATLLTFPLVIGLSLVLTWQHIMLVFAVLAGVGVWLIPAQKEEATGREAQRPKMPLEKGPVLIAVAFGLVIMGHAILLFLLPAALARTHENADVAMLGLAILGPSQVVGRLVWKAYGSPYRPQSLALVVFTVLCVPATLLLLFGASHFVIYLALAIQGACYGVHTILRPGLAQLYLDPVHLGQGLGAIAMVGVLMMAVGPAIGGVVWTAAGMTGLMATVLVLNFMALMLGIALRGTAQKGVTP